MTRTKLSRKRFSEVGSDFWVLDTRDSAAAVISEGQKSPGLSSGSAYGFVA